MDNAQPVTRCQSCGSRALIERLDLGKSPVAERYTTDAPVYPLTLLECDECGLVQLSVIVPQEELFRADHTYASGNSQALVRHFATLAERVYPHTQPEDLVVDIGCNDGTFLAGLRMVDGVHRRSGRLRLVGVDPTNQVLKVEENYIGTGVQAFFSAAVARRLVETYGRAQVVVSTNVLAHVPDVHDFLTGVRLLLADDGVYVTENHSLDSITKGGQVDTIYHEHQRYYTPASLAHLLYRNDLSVQEIETIPTHGGSFRTWVRRMPESSYLAVRTDQKLAQLNQLVRECADQGQVWGVSASTRATPLLHAGKLAHYISAVAEVPGSDKIGMVMPGTEIPIVDEKLLIEQQPPYALLFCWHIADVVVRSLREQGYKGIFIVPLPYARLESPVG